MLEEQRDRVVSGWSLYLSACPCCQVEQLKLYEMLISQARQPLLRHKAVLTPLLRLLSVCAEPASAPLENSLVLLLNQLCVSVAREPAILELFFHSHTDQGPANLIIFSLLIPFIHHEGARGQQARDALLLIMAMSASNRAVAQSITDNSYFCPVRIPVGHPPPRDTAGTLRCWHGAGPAGARAMGSPGGREKSCPGLGMVGGGAGDYGGLGNDGSWAMERLQMMENFGIEGLEVMEYLQVMVGLEVTE